MLGFELDFWDYATFATAAPAGGAVILIYIWIAEGRSSGGGPPGLAVGVEPSNQSNRESGGPHQIAGTAAHQSHPCNLGARRKLRCRTRRGGHETLRISEERNHTRH